MWVSCPCCVVVVLDAVLEPGGEPAAPWGAAVGGRGKDERDASRFPEPWLDSAEWAAVGAVGEVGWWWSPCPSFVRFFLRNPRPGI